MQVAVRQLQHLDQLIKSLVYVEVRQVRQHNLLPLQPLESLPLYQLSHLLLQHLLLESLLRCCRYLLLLL